jgi:hypothetical protein
MWSRSSNVRANDARPGTSHRAVAPLGSAEVSSSAPRLSGRRQRYRRCVPPAVGRRRSQHGTRGVAEDALRGRPEERQATSALSVSAHHDEVRLTCVRGAHDGRRRPAELDQRRDTTAHQSPSGHQAVQALQRLPAAVSHVLAYSGVGVTAGLLVRQDFEHVQQRQPRRVVPRDRQRMLQRASEPAEKSTAQSTLVKRTRSWEPGSSASRGTVTTGHRA